MSLARPTRLSLLTSVASRQLWRKDDKRNCNITADLPFPLPNLRGTTEAINAIDPGGRWRRAWMQTARMSVYMLAAKPKIAIPAFATRIGQRKIIPRII